MPIFKELQLEALGLFSEVVSGHGHAHYGFWEEPEKARTDLIELGHAQQVYFDRLVALFPDDVESILDVGSGTGSVARGLTGLGFRVDCVCPSPRLNEIARKKLPADVTIHETFFEDLETDERYDLLLFPESFHYIKARVALEKAARISRKYVLICDYFRKRDTRNDKKISHAQFLDLVDASGWRVVLDEDISANIAPTFTISEWALNEHVKPFVRNVFDDLKERKFFYRVFLSRIVGKKVDRLTRPHEGGKEFFGRYTYRHVLLERTA